MNRRHRRSASHWRHVFRVLLAGFAAVVAGLVARPFFPPAGAQESPARSVVQVWIMKLDVAGYQSRYQSEVAGTAFLVGADGRAVTNSHVLGPARTSPRAFQIVVTAGSEFFSGRIICASALPAGAGENTGLRRDVAVIQLVPPEIPVPGLTFAGVERWRPHQGPMPKFAALRFGPAPAVGDLVRVLGFGFRPGTVLPSEWSVTGTVGLLGQAEDGTAVFGIKFERDAGPGHSGSPVLNRQGEVIGMLTWLRSGERTIGMAISRAALDPACP